MWYGWIPNLIRESPTILHDHPLGSTGEFILQHQESGNAIRVRYLEDDVTEEIAVTIVNGFFQMDGLNEWEHNRAYSVMQNLYVLLKKSFHRDVTHTAGGGLSVVEADDLNAAMIPIADMMTDNCDLFLDEVDWMNDVMNLRILYLNGKGSAEYGLSFTERYKTALSDLHLEYCEHLTSVIHFIDAIYGTRCDVIQNEMAHLSHTTSVSMKELSEHTESLSIAVLTVTAVSVVLACMTFAYEHLELGVPAVAVAISTAVAIPALMMRSSRMGRGSDPASDRFRDKP